MYDEQLMARCFTLSLVSCLGCLWLCSLYSNTLKEYPQPDIAKIVTKVETTKTVYKTIKEKVPVYVRDNTCSINRGTIRVLLSSARQQEITGSPTDIDGETSTVKLSEVVGTTSGWAEQYYICKTKLRVARMVWEIKNER